MDISLKAIGLYSSNLNAKRHVVGAAVHISQGLKVKLMSKMIFYCKKY